MSTRVSCGMTTRVSCGNGKAMRKEKKKNRTKDGEKEGGSVCICVKKGQKMMGAPCISCTVSVKKKSSSRPMAQT